MSFSIAYLRILKKAALLILQLASDCTKMHTFFVQKAEKITIHAVFLPFAQSNKKSIDKF